MNSSCGNGSLTRIHLVVCVDLDDQFLTSEEHFAAWARFPFEDRSRIDEGLLGGQIARSLASSKSTGAITAFFAGFASSAAANTGASNHPATNTAPTAATLERPQSRFLTATPPCRLLLIRADARSRYFPRSHSIADSRSLKSKCRTSAFTKCDATRGAIERKALSVTAAIRPMSRWWSRMKAR